MNYLQNRFYYKGASIPKPLVRGYLHLIMILLSPAWIMYFWCLLQNSHNATLIQSEDVDLPVFKENNFHWNVWHTRLNPSLIWFIDLVSILFMLMTSCWYHLFCHSNVSQCEFARKLDMFMVNLAISLNLIPQILYCNMFLEMLVYFLLCIYTLIGIFFFNARQTMIISSVTGIAFTLFRSTAELGRCFADVLLEKKQHVSFLPIVTVSIIMAGIAMLYIFSDGDVPPKGKKHLVIGTHDIIHFLSLIVIINLCYYNSFLLSL